MLKLNKKIEYALISLKHISQKEPGSLSSAKEIATTYKTPFDVSSRVLQILAQRGWLISEQGAGGGYKLERSKIKDLSLFDLIEAIEGKNAVVKCLIEKKECPLKTSCNLASPMEQLNQNLNHFLKEQKVLELIAYQEEAPKYKEEVMHVGS